MAQGQSRNTEGKLFSRYQCQTQLAVISLISSEQSDAIHFHSFIFPLWMKLTSLPELSNCSRALFRPCFLATLNIHNYSYLLLLIGMIKKSSWNPWRQKILYGFLKSLGNFNLNWNCCCWSVLYCKRKLHQQTRSDCWHFLL